MNEAIEVIQPVWDEAREHAAFAGLLRRRQIRRRRLSSAVAILLLAFAGWQLWPSHTVRFTDGSTAQLLDGNVTEMPPSPGRVIVRLDGGARFEVRHDTRRRFRVEAGELIIEDLGTRFTVEKIAGRARVAVEHGRVRVTWRDGAAELGAGESGMFPPKDVSGDAVEALWREADRARRLGRPEDALAPLSQIVEAHAGDPRAPLAAFTLGRLYLDELHRPADAAAAFARARALDPDGPLAADARAREEQARGAR